MSSSGSSFKQQMPHALMFPFPAPGHINPMLQLAKRMLDEGFFITFVNTDHNHARMFRGHDQTPMALMPNLRFDHIPDGLPEQHQRFNEKPDGIVETIAALLALPGPLAKLVRRIVHDNESPPLTCIISDAFCFWVQDVADQFQLPHVWLWTTPVHANLAYTFQSTLQCLGVIPVKDKRKLHEVVRCIEGIAPMYLEDYISFFLIESTKDFMYQWILRLCMKRPEEAIWNLGNNFEGLEETACNEFKKVAPNFLPIGPLLPIDILRDNAQNVSAFTGIMSLMWPEDARCNEWLSQHERASVIYISFGSVVSMYEEEIGELIRGLEESKAPFVWVVRPDESSGALAQLREKLDAEAKQGEASHRGLVIAWAPQLAVLTHPSVGLFVSHCGWNSVTESVAAGVPVLAKPARYAEQRMNAHYVADVWKIGRRIPDGASASVVKSLIRSLLGSSSEDASVQQRMRALRQRMLKGLLPPDGSSHSNFKLFTDDMHRRAAAAALQTKESTPQPQEPTCV